MSRTVVLPPNSEAPSRDGHRAGGWWHDDPQTGRIICDLCPRACSLKPGDRGFCFVRSNIDGEMVLTTYGRSTGFCIDPIEKKPLNHFHPGTSVLSFGTAGCNLGCKFCQNWDISKSREVERLSELALPDAIASAAKQAGCRSVAFTYNDPVIWAEYAIDTARGCRAAGVKTVAVTAGYITPEAFGPFFEFMDAANVDLKAFSEQFYRDVTYSHIQPVLDTLRRLKHETDVWFEITNLLIPHANDDADELKRMCGWILANVGDEVPLHFSAFHPDFRMTDREATPHETLIRAHEIARAAGLKFAYVGNVHDASRQNTYCPACGNLVIGRDWYALGRYDLRGNRCGKCDALIPGRFDDAPGAWGRRRQPVDMRRLAGRTPDVVTLQTKAQAMNRPSAEAAPGLALDDEQREAIHAAACEFVAADVLKRPFRLADPTLAGAAGLPVAGAFVTLKRDGELRGCCGQMGPPRPLVDVLRQAAFRTATDDVRLPPVSPTELGYLDLSVNVLHDFRRVEARGEDRVAAVEVGRHGLRLQGKEGAGLLLPSVATENGWDSETFLRHVCRKAGLPTTAWMDDSTELVTFESIEFGGPLRSELVTSTDVRASRAFSKEELARLDAHAESNVIAMVRGSAPSHYALGVSDGNVAGLILTVEVSGVPEPLSYAQLSMRPGFPLQAALFGLCESAARDLMGLLDQPRRISARTAVLTDPAMHGTLAHRDSRGLDTCARAILAIDGPKAVCLFDPAADADALITRAGRELNPHNPAASGLFSLAIETNAPAVVFSTVPRPRQAGGTRRPAVAGRFYPGDPTKLGAMLDAMLDDSPRSPETHRAVMVPHAGLVYSGSLAATVFNRVEFPRTVIVIGPKHTRLGVDWAVAPHESWSIPGAVIPGDPELARALVEAIPGLQLDEAAHREEHAIEVELPFIAKLAPESRVVGIAVGGADLEGCRRFAEGLASVIRGMDEPPLLVVSSDMNHFADDQTTRRLDRIALDALATLDPETLLTTVREHDISMCGVLPAVIVLETLKRLGGADRYEELGHTTSASVSGDTSRVVGYAGALID